MPLLHSAKHPQGGSFILKYLFPFAAVFSLNPPIRRALSKRGSAASHRNFTPRGFSTGCPHCVILRLTGLWLDRSIMIIRCLSSPYRWMPDHRQDFHSLRFSFFGKFMRKILTACSGLGSGSGKVLAKGLCSFQSAMRGLFYPLITESQKNCTFMHKIFNFFQNFFLQHDLLPVPFAVY